MPVALSLPENNTEDAKPSPMGKAKRRRLRRPKGKPTPPRCARQPLPREGAREDTPSFQRKGGRMPPHRLPTKKAYDTRIPFSPYCHFERKREIFFVCDRSRHGRIADNGKHRTPCDVGSRCFMQTALRRKRETGNEKDPSAALGMTIRGKAYLTFFFN